jgi:hypothetical protein
MDNPLVDLNNLDRIEGVMTHGKVLHRPELEALAKGAAEVAKPQIVSGSYGSQVLFAVLMVHQYSGMFCEVGATSCTS